MSVTINDGAVVSMAMGLFSIFIKRNISFST